MTQPFEFKLPIAGKTIQWKPLNVGQQVDLGAAYQGQQAIYLSPAMYAARICSYPSDQGTKASCSLAEIKQWDEIDYSLFQLEVDAKESERLAAFVKHDEPRVLSMKMQKAASDAKEAALLAFKKLDEAVEVAKSLERAGAGPLSAA